MSEGTCNATLAPHHPGDALHRCSREEGHYDDSAEPRFGEDGWTSDPGGWHVTAGPEPTVWCDRAIGATPHSDAPTESESAALAMTPEQSLREKLIYFLEYAPHLKDRAPEERRAEAGRMVDAYAHELADTIRAWAEEDGGAPEYGSIENVLEAADRIDPLHGREDD
jgi:hypothetical protein